MQRGMPPFFLSSTSEILGVIERKCCFSYSEVKSEVLSDGVSLGVPLRWPWEPLSSSFELIGYGY